MIRNLTIVAVASFVLALGCFGGAAAIGGRELFTHGWTLPVHDWNIEINDDNDHVRIGPSYGVALGGDSTVDIAWRGSESLQLDVPAEIIYTQGPKSWIKITGPAELVQNVNVEGGRISFKNGAMDDKFLRALSSDKLSIEITAPAVRAFTLNGSGDLYLKAYNQPELSLAINGSGNVEAQGKAKKVELDISGSGEADLRSLEAGDARISVSGSGEAHVAPTGATQVDLAGSGDVYLTAKPSVLSSNVAGSGEVHQDW